jgi:hypothetical protein
MLRLKNIADNFSSVAALAPVHQGKVLMVMGRLTKAHCKKWDRHWTQYAPPRSEVPQSSPPTVGKRVDVIKCPPKKYVIKSDGSAVRPAAAGHAAILVQPSVVDVRRDRALWDVENLRRAG